MNKWTEILNNNDYLNAKKNIKNGVALDETDESGESVLAYAIKSKCDTDLIMLLIDNGADIFDFDDEGVSILDMAITYDNIELVNYLIENGVDVNQTNRRSGFTPLMAAVSYGRVEITKILLSKNVDQSSVDSKGFKAVDFAKKMKKKSVLALLDYDKNSTTSR